MFENFILVAVGALVGWNFPQPFWAVYVQEMLMEKWKAFKVK